jgi:hypothetical protein
MGWAMATVNFSVPDEVKELFNAAFAGKNRSAVVADLMRSAAEHELRLHRRREAVAEVLQGRATEAAVTGQQLADARQELRR